MSTKRKKNKGPNRDSLNALRSFTRGLYDETDKLAKKAPSSQLSDLATKRVNKAIADAKALMDEYDPYIPELDEFVPAGENPEVRDAVLVLREILNALNRVQKVYPEDAGPFGLGNL